MMVIKSRQEDVPSTLREERERGGLRHVGDTTITGKNQVSLPTKGLRALGWERGDQLLVQIVHGDMMMLFRRPTRWSDTFAGKLDDVFGGHDDTIAYLGEERQSWSDR